MTTVSQLNIAYGSFGAQAALDTLKSVLTNIESAGAAAGKAYAENERYTASLTALSASEAVNTGKAKDLAAARDLASTQAQVLLGYSQKLAILSPFNQDSAVSSIRLAQSYGFVSASADKAVISATRITQALFDYVAATGQTDATVPQLTKVFGQISATGRLLAGDINQLASAGINARKIIADSMGLSTAEFIKLQEQGLIPADRALQALISNLETNFGGAAAAQANTLSGALNSLQDLSQISLRAVASPSIDVLKGQINELAGALQDPTINAELQAIGRTAGNATQVIITGIREALPYIVQMKNAAPLIGGGIAGYGALQSVLALDSGVRTLAGAWRTASAEANALNTGTLSYLVQSNKSILLQAGAIGLVATLWGVALYEYQAYQAALQKGAKEVTHSDGTDKFIEDIRRRQRIALLGNDEQAKAQAQQQYTLDDKIKRLQDLQRTNEEDTVKDANRRAQLETGGYGMRLGTTEKLFQEWKAKQFAELDAAGRARKEQIEALKRDIEVGERQIEELMRGSGTSNKPTGPYAPSDEEQKLYDSLLNARIDFGIASQDRARDYNQKLLDIDKERSSKLLDAQQSYVSKVADIDRSSANQRLDENKSYSQRLVDIAKARQQALVDAAKTASTEGASALGSATAQDIDYLNGNETRLAAHVEKRRLLERQGAFCKLPEEDAAYRASERQAAQAYVNQERALQQSLGRQLIDYATAQALMRGIAQQNLDALTNAIRSQYGLQESSSERSFGRMRAVIDEWASAGGQSTSGYIERLGALREEASQTQQQIERLTKERTNALADRYSRGEIGRDDYLRQLRDIPAQVNKDVGLPNSSEPSQVLAKQKDFDQQAQQASIAHRQRLADIDRSAGQQRADAARQYGASVANINGEWYTKQRADAKDSYDKQEQQAALAYARQQKAQQASLNQQSNDFRKYVDQHLADDARMQIGLDANAQKQLAILQARRQNDKNYNDVQYAGDLAQLVTKSRPTNYTTYFPLGVPPGPGGRTSGGGVQVVVNNYGPVDSPARVNQIATVAADKVMDRLNAGVNDVIAAPPKGPR